MTMGHRIKTRDQLLDEQADAARNSSNLSAKRPDEGEHPDQPTAVLR
jgi:hypothetical protein